MEWKPQYTTIDPTTDITLIVWYDNKGLWHWWAQDGYADSIDTDEADHQPVGTREEAQSKAEQWFKNNYERLCRDYR